MNRRLSLIGAAATVVYLGLVALLAWGRWDRLRGMELNEIGDFLAGGFGPLAVLWLILGFFQQGEELRLNTEALKLQADELRQSVEQQRRLVELNNEEQAARREYAKPKFTVQGRQGSQDVERTLVQLDVQNHGVTATDIRVSLVPDCAWQPVALAILTEGAIFTQYLVIPAGREEVNSVRMTIHFTDAAGIEGATTFDVGLTWGPEGVFVVAQKTGPARKP